MHTSPSTVFCVALLWLAVTDVSPGVAADGCNLCRQTQVIQCPDCSGRGRGKSDCQHCVGSGKEPCLTCNPEAPTPPRANPLADVDPEILKKLGDAEKVRAALEALLGSFEPPPKVKIPVGKVDCTNRYCHGGRMHWRGGDKDPCRVCKSQGDFSCPDCHSGKARCKRCLGKRRVETICGTCAGHGQIACPGCLKSLPVKCPLCAVQNDRSCRVCSEGGHGSGSCYGCDGKGETACSACRGVDRVSCTGCGGCGKIRTKTIIHAIGETKGGIRTCHHCGGRGYDRCNQCDKGDVLCLECEGGKKLTIQCPDEGSVGCLCKRQGVHTSFQRWAEILETAQLRPQALQCYQRALAYLEQDLARVEKEIETARTAVKSAEKAEEEQGAERDQETIDAKKSELKALQARDKKLAALHKRLSKKVKALAN